MKEGPNDRRDHCDDNAHGERHDLELVRKRRPCERDDAHQQQRSADENRVDSYPSLREVLTHQDERKSCRTRDHQDSHDPRDSRSGHQPDHQAHHDEEPDVDLRQQNPGRCKPRDAQEQRTRPQEIAREAVEQHAEEDNDQRGRVHRLRAGDADQRDKSRDLAQHCSCERTRETVYGRGKDGRGDSRENENDEPPGERRRVLSDETVETAEQGIPERPVVAGRVVVQAPAVDELAYPEEQRTLIVVTRCLVVEHRQEGNAERSSGRDNNDRCDEAGPSRRRLRTHTRYVNLVELECFAHNTSVALKPESLRHGQPTRTLGRSSRPAESGRVRDTTEAP